MRPANLDTVITETRHGKHAKKLSFKQKLLSKKWVVLSYIIVLLIGLSMGLQTHNQVVATRDSIIFGVQVATGKVSVVKKTDVAPLVNTAVQQAYEQGTQEATSEANLAKLRRLDPSTGKVSF